LPRESRGRQSKLAIASIRSHAPRRRTSGMTNESAGPSIANSDQPESFRNHGKATLCRRSRGL
jgi:hypothetical protein